MSDSEDNTADTSGRESLGRLEALVSRLLEEQAEASRRARRAEARVEDLESLLRSVGPDRAGASGPSDLHAALLHLKERNRDLHGRIDEGRAGVERLIAQLRFLEDQG